MFPKNSSRISRINSGKKKPWGINQITDSVSEKGWRDEDREKLGWTYECTQTCIKKNTFRWWVPYRTIYRYRIFFFFTCLLLHLSYTTETNFSFPVLNPPLSYLNRCCPTIFIEYAFTFINFSLLPPPPNFAYLNLIAIMQSLTWNKCAL